MGKSFVGEPFIFLRVRRFELIIYFQSNLTNQSGYVNRNLNESGALYPNLSQYYIHNTKSIIIVSTIMRCLQV